MRQSLAFTIVVAGSVIGSVAQAQTSGDGMWRFASADDAAMRAPAWVRPQFYEGAVLDLEVFRGVMADAPMEFTREAWERPTILELPAPDGAFQRFEVWESPVMHPDLAAKLPGVKTYAGQGIDDPTATLRFDITQHGFHAQVLSADRSWYIDPFSQGDTSFYASYFKSDLRDRTLDGFECAVTRGQEPMLQRRDQALAMRSGTFLQTYRTAVGATGEYTDFHSPSVPPAAADGQAAIVTAINRVTGVYEREMAIRLQLVANNLNVVFTNSATDPYTNNNGGAMLSQNQTTLDNVAFIGSANYDLGHVFSTGGGGIAALGVVCRAGLKAQGVTGLGFPTGDAFYIDYVAHEMGHQFGAAHSYNGTASSCSGQRSATAAYEPGSGSTIMSYAGICGADNLQANSDDYFVHISFDQILAYSTGANGGCPTNVANGNTVPSVDAGPNFTIPRQTPFILTPASASDPNGDTITYCWEQRDLGAAQSSSGGAFADNGSSPIIRSFDPTTSPSRIIPRLSNLLANTFVIGEALPNTNRTLNFRLTVRDNRAGGGGVNTDDMQVAVTTSAGPFAVTAPNAGGTFPAGPLNVTWNVASTNLAPVNTANVAIELSTDGGNTWPTVLAASTANDGSEMVTLPSVSTNLARIRVRAVGNIYFDISNVNFTITAAPPPGAFTLTTPSSGSTGVSLTPTLGWTMSSGASSYTVTLDSDPLLTPPAIFSTTIAGTSVMVPGGLLVEGQSYFWRVVANGTGSTNGTPNPATFTTVTPPPFCQGDANGDMMRDFGDITTVLSNFGNMYTPGSAGPGDANNDGMVNFVDISTVLSTWGVPC